MQLIRLNSTFAVLAYRNPYVNYQLYAALVDVSMSAGLTILPAMVLSPGSAKSFGLGVSLTAVSQDRLVFTYNDAYSQAWVMDAGVFGPSVVSGRCG
jgi:hypothetical protein